MAGVTLVGPLPADIQNFTIYAAGIGSGAQDVAAARAVLKFLSGAESLAIIKAKGMEPAVSRQALKRQRPAEAGRRMPIFQSASGKNQPDGLLD